MQLSDAGDQLVSRPSPNATNNPGWFNNDPTASSPATVVDPDLLNAIMAEMEAIATLNSQSLSKANTAQVLAGIQYLIAQGVGLNQGRLSYSSASAIVFGPKNGTAIRIAGTLLSIPAAGVSIANTGVEVGGVANQSLADSTTYDVYLKNVSGTLTPSFYVDGGGGTHMTDTTAGNIGTEVYSNSGTPDSTRSYIGKIRTNASGQFVDTASNRLVASWFNQRQRDFSGANTSGATTTSNSAVELTTSSRVNVLTWGDEATYATCVGYSAATNINGAQTQVGLNGSIVGTPTQDTNNTNGNNAQAAGYAGTPTEGLQTFSPFGLAGSSATGTFVVAIVGTAMI